MTSFNIGTELTGCTDEELAAIVLRLAALQELLDPKHHVPSDPTAHPRHCRCNSCGHCRPSARRSDYASSSGSKHWWERSRSNTPPIKAEASHSKAWPVSPHSKQMTRSGLIPSVRCGRQSPCRPSRSSKRSGDFIKDVEDSTPPMRQADDDS